VAEDRNSSASLRRALTVLAALREPTADGIGLALVDLAEKLDMNKSTLLRLIKPLRDFDLVCQTADGRYRIGVGAVALGDSYLAGLDLRAVARPALEALAQRTGETAHLLVYSQLEVTYVDKVDAPSSIRMASRIGNRMPMYCTASGKVFLAYLTNSPLEAVIAAGLNQRTPNTITSSAALREAVDGVRRIGYAIDDVENEPEIRCVSAPIFGHDAEIAAAISISGPESRMTLARTTELGLVVRSAAREISVLLGAPPVRTEIQFLKGEIA